MVLEERSRVLTTKSPLEIEFRKKSIKKSYGIFCKRVQVKYAWILEHQNEFSVSAMCKVMNLSRSSYYEHLHKPESVRAKEDKEMSFMFTEIFKEGRATYGARRIRQKLVQRSCRILSGKLLLGQAWVRAIV